MSQQTDLEAIDNDVQPKTDKAKFITAAYNIIAFLAGFYMLFADSLSSVLLVLAYPLLGIAIALLSNGDIKLADNGKKRLVGSLNIGFMIPIIFMAIKSTDEYTLLQTTDLWFSVIVISLIVAAALFKTGINPFVKEDRTNAIFMLILAVAYGYGGAREINCAFDKADPQIYRVTVLAKTAHHSRKSDSYYFTLTPWGPRQAVNEAEVDGLLYDHKEPGAVVHVNFRPGLLHAPWFIVTE